MRTQEPTDSSRRRQGWNALKSAHYAFSGLMWIAPRTPSLKLAIAVSVALVEIAVLILAATLLLAVETLNTAVEMLCDHLHPEPHPQIGRIKDVAAAATAFCEIGTAFVVLLVLVPHVSRWFGH